MNYEGIVLTWCEKKQIVHILCINNGLYELTRVSLLFLFLSRVHLQLTTVTKCFSYYTRNIVTEWAELWSIY